MDLKAQKTDLTQFRKTLKDIIYNEIKTIYAPNQKLIEVMNMLDYMQFPLIVTSHVNVPTMKPNNRAVMTSILGSAITGIAMCRMLHKTPTIPAVALSLGCAAVTGFGLNRLTRTENDKSVVKVEYSIDSTVEGIATDIDKMVNMISILVIEKKLPLDASYPTVLGWYQQVYADCDEFGTECAKYFRKRIEAVLHESSYTLQNYDGTNDTLFIKTIENNITSIKQNMPAITNEQGYILSGRMSVPSDNK